LSAQQEENFANGNSLAPNKAEMMSSVSAKIPVIADAPQNWTVIPSNTQDISLIK